MINTPLKIRRFSLLLSLFQSATGTVYEHSHAEWNVAQYNPTQFQTQVLCSIPAKKLIIFYAFIHY